MTTKSRTTLREYRIAWPPWETLPYPNTTPEECLHMWGVQLLDIEPPHLLGYPKMMRVALPDGWEVQYNDHWTIFMDEQGRTRFKAHYKDETTRINARSHFVPCFIFDDKDGFIKVMANGKVIHTVPRALSKTYDEYTQSLRDAEEKAKEWLDKKYPFWNDPIKSWGYRI